MILKTLVLGCAVLAGNASASVLLDFTGVGNGAAVNDFYNGGTDSMGNSGVNYGIHVSGTVTYLNGNPVINGGALVTFAPRTDVTAINFNASQSAQDGLYQYLYFGSGYVDMGGGFVDTTIDPLCSTPADCASKGYFYRSIEQLMPQRIPGYPFPTFPITGLTPSDGLAGVQFRVNYLDDIQFVSASWGPTDPASVPVPAPFALLGAGVAAFMAARRRA